MNLRTIFFLIEVLILNEMIIEPVFCQLRQIKNDTFDIYRIARHSLQIVDSNFSKSEYYASIGSQLIKKHNIIIMRYFIENKSCRSSTLADRHLGVVAIASDSFDSNRICFPINSIETFNNVLSLENVNMDNVNKALEVARLYVRCLAIQKYYPQDFFFLDDFIATPSALNRQMNSLHWLHCEKVLSRYLNRNDIFAIVRLRKNNCYKVEFQTVGLDQAAYYDFRTLIESLELHDPLDALSLLEWQISLSSNEITMVKVSNIKRRLYLFGCSSCLPLH